MSIVPRAIGIDLGTTKACVAVVEDGQPIVIPDRGGYKTTHSMVAIAENGKRLVGHIAKRQAVTNAEHTVSAAKRLIGRPFNSAPVKQAIEAAPYKIVEGPHDDVRIELRGKTYSIPELSAYVLQEMRRIAEEHLGTSVDKAVITVPAYFNDGQRQATKDAGRIAGLDVIRIINEPTAAALAYGFGKDLKRKVAVYDLGGGTFDISILDIRNGVFEVMATAGDTFLGGEDFDKRVIDWLVADFAREHTIDLCRDKMALQRLRDVAERAKRELSTTREMEINLPFIVASRGEAFHLTRDLTRDQLEELTADLVQRTIDICKRMLQQAGVSRDAIDDVILVGGMTRMPLVRKVVAEFFGREPCKGVHPDEVVALGAAIQGSAIVDERSEMRLLDVTPRSLGIMIAGGSYHRLIEQNSKVPTSRSRVFTAVDDNHASAKIRVLQGEHDRAEDSELLGELTLSGLRNGPKGEADVSFAICADGIVSVSARDLGTGQQKGITFTATSGLTEEEVERMAKESKDYLVAMKQSEEAERQGQAAQKLLEEAEGLFARVEPLLSTSEEGRDAIRKAHEVLQGARAAIARRDTDSLQALLAMLRRLLRGGDDDGGGPAGAAAAHPAQFLPGPPYWRRK